MKGRHRARALLVFTGLLALTGGGSFQWPYDPGRTAYELGNNYGEYQRYQGTEGYYHDGIDILAGSPRPVYALQSGTVVYEDRRDPLASGVVIGEPIAGGKGIGYWHLNNLRISLGDQVREGDRIGDVVHWPDPPKFHHLHLNKVRGTGGYPWTYWIVIGNPLLDLEPNDDNSPPVFPRDENQEPFGFSQDNSDAYIDPSKLHGRVDIVAKIHDRFNTGSNWDLIPYSITLRIERVSNGALTLERTFIIFDGELGEAAELVSKVYKQDSRSRTTGNYQSREFYFVVTNHVPANSGSASRPGMDYWDTCAVPNGDYRVIVFSSDLSGNTVESTMIVTVDNQ